MKTFAQLDELLALAGQEVAVSDWVTVSQARIQQFADATGDHQWIHLDEERARAFVEAREVSEDYGRFVDVPD